MSHVFAVEMYPFYCLVRISSRFDQCISESRDAQDAAAAGDSLSFFVKGSSRVEAVIAFLSVKVFKAVDDFAFLITSGISA